ncbi:MAG: class I SAM-dependent methyltransferase [Candidatus Limnocylindrales bacterium]
MVGERPLPLSLWMLGAALLVGLAAVHAIAYAVGYGIDGYEAAMVASGHEPWWTLAAAVAVALLAGAAAAVRTRVRFSRARVVEGRRARAALVLRTWALLLVGSVAGYVLLENAEHLVRAGHLAGLAPLGQVVRLAALGPLVAVVTALALLAVAVAVVGRVEYATVLTRSYATLVADGTFDDAFLQSPWAVAFAGEVLGPLLREAGPDASVLEAGCGTGVWLEELARLAEPLGGTRLHGFDLSADMAGAASVRLGRAGVSASVWQGDVLDDAAYGDEAGALHELVFAYDVVQQLPSDVQAEAVSTMLRHVAPGGHLVVFDHDRRSRYGRVMGAKKWLRRYLGVPLVPRFYIHARYPELERIRRDLEREGHTATVVVEPEARKRALVVRRA